MKVISVTAETHSKLKKLAEEEERSLKVIIQRAIDVYIAQKQTESNK